MAREQSLQFPPFLEADVAGSRLPKTGVISTTWLLLASAILHVAVLGAVSGRDSGAVSSSSSTAEIWVDVLEVPQPVAPPLAAPTEPVAHAGIEASLAKPPPAHLATAAVAPAVTEQRPQSVEGTSSPAPRFAIVLPTDDAPPGGEGGSNPTSAPSASNVVSGSGETAREDGPVSEGSVDAPASLVSSGPLPYPEAARRAGIEADVGLEITVSRSGLVESATLVRRAGYGLDEAALAATRAFRFKAAMRRGRAVRVRMRWDVQFRLQ